jgi:hypothetical protein
MSSSVQIVRYTDDLETPWSCLAAQSPDAWFWHTRAWLEFAVEVGRDHFISDLSFVIVNDSAPAAICPVILEAREGYRRFSYLGEFIPFPAFAHDLTEIAHAKLLEVYVGELERLADEHDVAYTRVAVPALSPGRFVPGPPMLNPLLEYGFFDLAWQTQVIDLTLPESELWKGLRKGHRSDVKRAAGAAVVSFWDQAAMTTGKFSEYRELHERDAGRVTRSAHSFDLMEQWIRDGTGVLVEAAIDGRPIAFALLVLFGAGAYYGSGCKDPDHASVPSSHLIQWESMRWLKLHGYRYYDIGVQHFGPQLHHVPSDKEIGIASFKRGFGGRTVPVLTAERFYSPALFEQQWKRRVEGCLPGMRTS